jgi:hypothetical protein
MAETSRGRAAVARALGPQIACAFFVLLAHAARPHDARAEPELALRWSAPANCRNARGKR